MIVLNRGYLKKENKIVDLKWLDIMNGYVYAYDREEGRTVKYNSKYVNVMWNSLMKDVSGKFIFSDDVVADSEGTQYIAVVTGRKWFLRKRLDKTDHPMSEFASPEDQRQLNVRLIGNVNIQYAL
jgi:hypothetical protein